MHEIKVNSFIIILLFLICLNYIKSNKFISFFEDPDSLKDGFSTKFKIGTAVSSHELNLGQNL